MDQEKIIRRTADHVRRELSGDATGHDWWHIQRVRVLALRLGREEGADLFVVELAALLHDIADWKFQDGDLEAGPRQAAAWLAKCGVERTVIERVRAIVGSLSFKGAEVESSMATLEGQVVQDPIVWTPWARSVSPGPSPTEVPASARCTIRTARRSPTPALKPIGIATAPLSTTFTRSCYCWPMG